MPGYSDASLNPYRNRNIDWGLLQGGGDRSQTREVPNPAPELEARELEGLGQQAQEAARTNIAKTEANARVADINSEISDRSARLGMEQQLQPYRIGQMQASTNAENARTQHEKIMAQGEAVNNAIRKIQLKGEEMTLQEREDLIKSSASGNFNNALDVMAKHGDWEGRFKTQQAYYNTLETEGRASQEQVKGNTLQMGGNGPIMAKIMAIKDPQQQLQAFQQALPVIIRNDPKTGSIVNLDNINIKDINNYALGTIGASQALMSKQASNQIKQTPLQQNTEWLQGLQQKAQAGDQNAVQQLKIANSLQTKSQKTVSVADKTWGSEGQKRFYDLQKNRLVHNNIEDYTSNILSLTKGMPDASLGPLTGPTAAIVTQKGQEVNKMFATLIPLTVSNLGIPATALRSAQMIKLIGAMNPSNRIYKPSVEYLTNFMRYENAKTFHSEWQEQSNMIDELKDQDPKGVAQWHANNPDPLLNIQKPNFNDLKRLDPAVSNIVSMVQNGEREGQVQKSQKSSSVIMPSFQFKGEFQSWYKALPEDQKQQVRSQLSQ